MNLDKATLKLIGGSIQHVWQEVSPDMGPCSRAEAAEVSLDAGRLGEIDPEAEKIVDGLIKEHGYAKTLRWIANNLF